MPITQAQLDKLYALMATEAPADGMPPIPIS
jgi:hypothetical protein